MLTDYKYRKLRKMVKTARISDNGKELFFCAIRQYKKKLEPVNETFTDGRKSACLVGAAIADVMGKLPSYDNDSDEWRMTAVKEFRLKPRTVNNIIEGFDDPAGTYNKSRYTRLAANVSKFLGLGNDRD